MKKFILVLSLFFIVTYAFALQPPKEGEIASLRRSGDLAERLNFALRLGNHKFSPALIDRANQRVQTGNNNLPAPPSGWQGMPTKGNIKTFALLIAFQDYLPPESTQSIHNKLFGSGDPSKYPYESLANYYDRSSYNQLNLHDGVTCDWYIAPYPKSSVPQTSDGQANLIKEALNHCKQQGYNFSQFDNDGDGDIDYFMVIWSGPYGAWSSFWWGYQTRWWDSSYTIDGKRLSSFSWQMYDWDWSAQNVFNPSVVIHETGHALGLPDFYDYNNDVGPKGGVGSLDMMAGNVGDHNAFSKWMLEWMTPTFVASGTQNLPLKSLGSNAEAVVIMPNVNKDKLFSEYFLVENRFRVGNDQSSYFPPNDGFLIWHVDARLNEWGTSFLFDNSSTDHKLLRLMEADGLEEIEKGYNANAGDYYTKGKFFTDSSFPNSKKYNGTSSGVSITNISDVGNTMSATFSITGITTTKTNYFTVFNDGNADLVVSSITPETSAPWITVNPSSFVVIPNSSQSVGVTVDYSLVPQGSSTTKLRVNSNDPDENPYPNGITINVTSSNPIPTPTPSETLPTSASFCVPVAVEQDLYVHIPDLIYNGGVHLWANLRFIQEQGKLLFEVVGFGMNYPTCASATLSSDFKLHIPNAIFSGDKYWLDFQLYSTSNGKFVFELMNYGRAP
jgi:M6 family metalloprotease-like protein